MIKIKNKTIPFGARFKAINLFGILFYKGSLPNEKTIRHEKIHTRQIVEIMLVAIPIAIVLSLFVKVWITILLYIFSFYIVYLLEWFIKIFKYWNFHKTYRNISFEKEAYVNQDDIDYLKNRKHFSWIKYI